MIDLRPSFLSNASLLPVVYQHAAPTCSPAQTTVVYHWQRTEIDYFDEPTHGVVAGSFTGRSENEKIHGDLHGFGPTLKDDEKLSPEQRNKGMEHG